ncbi:MAG: glycosyltransferase family 1 protein [Desulforudis sp.]|jgi:glycosyltransferase involved in cell wall biosynthesis|nr:MAG: glycosyltransferase family 1 protein [Desulforudis sp.]
MNILIINTYHYLRGGDCRHAFALADALEKLDHVVHFFGMQSPLNTPTHDAEYFVSEIDYRKALSKKNPITAIKVFLRSIYSLEARRNLARMLDDIKPDIAHLHSIRHHLTKSILPELAKRNIPIVWTLHDYKELCPNTSFYDGGGICEDCKGGQFFHVIKKRCKKGSLPASIVAYIEAQVDRLVGYSRYVDLYISPSEFLKAKFMEYGYLNNKITTIPNFIELDRISPDYDHDNYLFFLGRLEKEKGIITLLKGFDQATKTMPGLRLKIAGSGSLEQELQELARSLNTHGVEFLGHVEGQDLVKLTKRAKAVVVPSEWYENYPYSCLEAMASGKPIIASRIGGIPELVEDEITGFLFEPFNVKQLAEKIKLVGELSPEQIKEIGQRAREKVETGNSKDKYLEKIIPIYSRLINERRNKKQFLKVIS